MVAKSTTVSRHERWTPVAAKRTREAFHRFAQECSRMVASAWAFAVAVAVVVVWALFGPAFGYSDTWQLVINTGTTIVTFLMVFLIQNTQNRDTRALHLKLDELLRAVKSARNQLVDLEDLSEEELDRLQRDFAALQQRSRQKEKTLGGSGAA